MAEINERIEKIAIKYFDGNNSKFAKLLGTNEANIRNYRTKVIPKTDFIIMLNIKLEISFDWVLLGIGDEKKVDDKSLFEDILKKKDKQIANLQREIVELKEKAIVPNVKSSCESNINYKELADARLEIIEGLKFRIATFIKETDEDKSSATLNQKQSRALVKEQV
jgi:hypothetical protein